MRSRIVSGGRGSLAGSHPDWLGAKSRTTGCQPRRPTRHILAAAVLCVLAGPSFAGEIAYDLSPPLTSDRDSCGAKDAPLDDFDHYRVVLYRCTQDSLVRRQPPLKPLWITRVDSTVRTVTADSVGWSGIPDGIHGWTKVWSVDRSGNVSCGYLSDTWVTPAVATPVTPPDTTGGIAPRFYAEPNRGGRGVYGPRSAIDYYWSTASPYQGIPADQWSADFTGKLVIPTSGVYTLYLKSEDGGQVFLDGSLIINKWGIQPLTEWSTTVTLMAGEHALQVTYMANNGNSECHLLWSGPGIPKQPIPRSAFR